MEFEELKSVFETWLDTRDDPGLLRIVYGAACANFYEGNPVWLMLIGSAGSGKTEMLMSLSKAENSVTISSLTPNALLSGQGSDESLLPQLNGKILIIKDLSSVTEIGGDDRGLLFAYLRDAYDGSAARSTGRGTIRFEGKFGILAAGTLAVEQGRKMDTLLGERFLYIRMRTRPTDILETSLKNATRKKEMREDIQSAGARFLNEWKPGPTRTLPGTVVQAAKASAKVLVQARSLIVRDSYNKEISFPAEVTEIPTRVYEQIVLLISAMRYLGAERDELLRTVKRLLVDSIPYTRLRVLQSISEGKRTVAEVCQDIKLSRSYTDRVVDDLDKLGILKKSSSNLSITSDILAEALEEKGEREE